MQVKNNDFEQTSQDMAIELKQIIDCAFSFVIYTTNPVTVDGTEVCIKLAIGHSDSFKSLTGSPYKLTYNKTTKECLIGCLSTNFAGFFADSSGDLVERPIDYSKIQFTNDHESLIRLG